MKNKMPRTPLLHSPVRVGEGDGDSYPQYYVRA